MNGRWIVITLFTVALAAAAGAAWYRQAARPGWARALADETRRGQALRKLLSLNGLFGSAREGFLDASKSSPGLAYVQGQSEDGRRWHVVRAETPSPDGGRARGAFVFTADGDVAHYLAGGAPFLVRAAATGSDSPLAMVLAPDPADAKAACVWRVGAAMEKRLTIRGAFGIQAATGEVITIDKPPQPQPLDASLPVFGYDPTQRCFRGPQPGADKACEVVPAESPGHCN